MLIVKKVKAVQLQAWSGPEGSRKLRFPDFMTTAQDGGKVVSPTHRPPMLLLPFAVVEAMRRVPDAVDRVICAPDDGWRNHLKHVEQFTDKINCV